MYKSEYWQKVKIFVKTKNAPWGLKRKINHKFFFGRGVPKRGGWGGGGPDIWEKFPNNSVFFFWCLPLIYQLGHEKSMLGTSNFTTTIYVYISTAFYTLCKSICHVCFVWKFSFDNLLSLVHTQYEKFSCTALQTFV